RSEKMSKSKKNTVDPRYIIESFGADTARLFMLSDSPPERDLEWTDAGIDGAWRYVQRLWRLMIGGKDTTIAYLGKPQAALTPELAELRSLTHKTIAWVTGDIEAFHFNKAVARVRTLTNALEAVALNDEGARWVLAEGLSAVVHLIAPLMPHFAEEVWVL